MIVKLSKLKTRHTFDLLFIQECALYSYKYKYLMFKHYNKNV